MLAIKFRMVSVFPVPGGPSITEIERVRAFSTAALTEIAAERENGDDIWGPRLDRRAVQERIEYALRVNESEFFVAGPQGIVAGQAGYDGAPVVQHTGHPGSHSRRGDYAHLGSRVGVIILPGLRSVEDSRPGTGGTGEGQDFGRACPGAPVNFEPFACRQRVPSNIAENPHAVRSVVEGLMAANEYDFDSRTCGPDLRYVSRPVFKLMCRAIADQDRYAPRIDHTHHLSCDVP